MPAKGQFDCTACNQKHEKPINEQCPMAEQQQILLQVSKEDTESGTGIEPTHAGTRRRQAPIGTSAGIWKLKRIFCINFKR